MTAFIVADRVLVAEEVEEISTVLDHAVVLALVPLYVVLQTAWVLADALQATLVADTAVGAVLGLEVTLSVRVVHARGPYHVHAPVLVQDLTPLTRDILEAEAVREQSVEVEEVIVGMILGIVGPGPLPKLVTKKVS